MTTRCPPLHPYSVLFMVRRSAVNSGSPASFLIWSLHLFSGLLLLIICSLSALVTHLIARRQRISKTSGDCIPSGHSVQASAPHIAIGSIRTPNNLAFSLLEMLLLENVPFQNLPKAVDAKAKHRLTSLSVDGIRLPKKQNSPIDSRFSPTRIIIILKLYRKVILSGKIYAV